MSNQVSHIEEGSEAFKKSMEEYRQELLKDNWKEDSQGYKSLMALHHHLIATPQEQLEKEWAEVEENTKDIKGPTVEEYFESLNPQAMYQKGYQEGAKRYKELVEEYFKGWVAQINEQKEKDRKEHVEKIEQRRKELGLPEDAPVFISPGVTMKEISFHPRPIDEIITYHILPQLQEIFDKN